jgi:uncharacterized protein HemX
MEKNNINQEPQNTPTENMSSQDQQEPQATVFQEKESKVGPIIGSLIVIVIILVGGIYFWSTQIEKINSNQNSQTEEQEENQDLSEVNSVEAELETIDFDSIDAELDAIDAEFEAEA